jgi:poly(beta-D-mannuronate) lyase
MIRPLSFAPLVLLGLRLNAACLQAPPPIRDISANSYYIDKQHSITDPVLKAREVAAVKPLEDFLSQLSLSADHWVAQRDPAAAGCGIAWLRSWAEGGALLGRMSSNQAEYERKWMLCGLGLAYLEMKDQASPQDRAAIEPWLGKVAEGVEAYEDKSKHHNNHHYWAALGVGAVGLSCNQPYHWAWARRAYIEAMQAIGPDGSLPLEMARGRKALAYHNYALAPLVLLAELARRHQVDWYSLEHGAIHRLVGLTLSGLKDPTVFEKRTGLAQIDLPKGGILGWAEFYSLRFPDEGAQSLLRPGKAAYYPRLGGNLKALAAAWSDAKNPPPFLP